MSNNPTQPTTRQPRSFVPKLIQWTPLTCFSLTLKMIQSERSRHTVTVSSQENKKDTSTQVYYLPVGTMKSLNSAFCIFKLLSQFLPNLHIYFLLYFHSTSHIKIEGNYFSNSQYIHFKLPNFLHIFLCTKLQIYFSRVKITFACFDFFKFGTLVMLI